MQERVLDDGVALVLGIELGLSAEPKQRLHFLQCCLKAEAQADQPVSRGVPPSGKNLVQVYLAHAGAFC